ncbi:MAG TPA: hypothetical protein VF263_23970, partial [Longimicrobiaceae bacterium]
MTSDRRSRMTRSAGLPATDTRVGGPYVPRSYAPRVRQRVRLLVVAGDQEDLEADHLAGLGPEHVHQRVRRGSLDHPGGCGGHGPHPVGHPQRLRLAAAERLLQALAVLQLHARLPPPAEGEGGEQEGEGDQREQHLVELPPLVRLDPGDVPLGGLEPDGDEGDGGGDERQQDEVADDRRAAAPR